jgi:hypothetical protein
MTVAYRSDTGTLLVDNAAGPVSIAFVGTQPAVNDLITAGGSFVLLAPIPSTVVIRDDVNPGDYIDSRTLSTNGNVQNFGLVGGSSVTESVAVVRHKLNKGNGNPHNVLFGEGLTQLFSGVGAIAFSGVDQASPLDVTAGSFTQNTNSSHQATGSTASTARADAVAVTAVAVDNSADVVSFTVTGYTITAQSTNGSGHAVGGLAYKVLSAVATQSADWVFGASTGAATDDCSAVITVFKGIDPGAVPTYNSDVPPKSLLHQPGIANSVLRDVRDWF